MRFGRYELISKLAAGGMGEVFQARVVGVEGFEKPIALKRIYPHLGADETYRRLFIREAKVTADLVHPNIVQVYELGEQEGQLYIAMEFIKGTDLGEILNRYAERRGTMPTDMTAVIAFDVLEALDFAHGLADGTGLPLNVVHRDISPQNILVSYHSGFVKICDFGVARATGGSGDLLEGKLVGKFRYMSPEQARGEKIDRRVDLYALGVVLFEASSGRPYLEEMNPIDLLNIIEQGRLPKLQHVRPDLPEGFVRMVDKALACDPNERYRNAAEFREAVERYLTRFDPRKARNTLRDLARESADGVDLPQHGAPDPSEGEGTRRWTELVTRAASSVEGYGSQDFSDLTTRDQRDHDWPALQSGDLDARHNPTEISARDLGDVPFLNEPDTDDLATKPSLPSLMTESSFSGSMRPKTRKHSLEPLLGLIVVTGIGSVLALSWVYNQRYATSSDAVDPAIDRTTLQTAYHDKSESQPDVVPQEGHHPGAPGRQAPTANTGSDEPSHRAAGQGDPGKAPIHATTKSEPQQKRRSKRKPGTRRVTSKKRKVGFLNLTVKPWAYVYIDNKRCEQQAPFVDYELAAGRHKVRVKHPTGKERVLDVVIHPGKTTEISDPFD